MGRSTGAPANPRPLALVDGFTCGRAMVVTMDDVIHLEQSEWGLWRHAALRAAGFPVAGLDLFGDREDEQLPALAGDPGFREAVTWQNRAALRNAVDRVSPADSGGRQRRRLETVASYWQRYCAKNDTIGFFGPLAWGQFTDDGPALSVRSGALVAPSRRPLRSVGGAGAGGGPGSRPADRGGAAHGARAASRP